MYTHTLLYQADWKALRGALVGCLSLMRRKDQVTRVSLDDAKAVLESFLQSLHVQSLGQHDRRVGAASTCIMLIFMSQLIVYSLIFLGDSTLRGIHFLLKSSKTFLQLCFELLECLLENYSDVVILLV